MKVSFSVDKRKIISLAVALLFSVPQFVHAEDYGHHTVQKGETLYSLSRQYGTSVDELKKINALTTNDIKVGQSLNVPQRSDSSTAIPDIPTQSMSANGKTITSNDNRKFDVYTVQKGDTFYHIAKVNGISVDELTKLNGLSSSDKLRVGDQLKIPVTIVDTSKASLPDLPSNDPRNYATKKGDSNLAWPVKNPTVTYTNGKVSGVHLSAKKNETVTAIRAGTVMYVGNYRGYGQVVFVQSKTGHIYVYAGLGSISVKKGDYVVFGDNLGTAGTDSIKGTSQISLMVFLKSNPIDPAKAPRG